ncbi:hypothetical protein CBF34_08765 [Vagococcus penaei]|uniref:Uncharacterized protein n=1 Tax=Vagococcus penaei TaxID=633807 RepID=A0A1Q2D7B1_9ENTE|nr:endonuclease/exonuclease/phosphatase family protein [Vagococcus penaei]AQP54210.1 hypothetical protein BW732_08230 [Vagococcus penaei]RST99994.1 hypothetical protein CBF34_08765 [Vagococcus penaei]
MKCLTLNTHSWLESDPLTKLANLATFIHTERVDVIALQEVNQLIATANVVNLDDFFIPIASETVPIKQDNYAIQLIAKLKELGDNYYWSWCYSHVGYDKYHEGVAILAKRPFVANAILVSPMDDPLNYRTRRQLIASFSDYHVLSGHYSWWTGNQLEGFQAEWQATLNELKNYSGKKLLAGDFNAPSNRLNESYALICQSFTDTYHEAQEQIGSATVGQTIDGWQDVTEAMRIDYVFMSSSCQVQSYRVVFDGKQQPIISDHFGVLVDIMI